MDRMKMKGWVCKYEIDRVKNLGCAVQDEMSKDVADRSLLQREKDLFWTMQIIVKLITVLPSLILWNEMS